MVTHRDKCFRIGASRTQEVSDLCCSHEKAGTRTLFHAGHDVECGTDINNLFSRHWLAVLAISVSHKISAWLFFSYWYQTRIT